MTTTLTTEQREIDLVRRFVDGTPLSPEDFTFGQANHLLFGNAGCGWALTEYGRSLLNGMQPPGDSASCPDDDSYLAPNLPGSGWTISKAAQHQAGQDALNQEVRSALDVQPDGDHYKGMAIQPVQFIEANNIRFLEGCIIKRACRHGSKTGAGAKDLRKIIHEAQLLLELRYGEKP